MGRAFDRGEYAAPYEALAYNNIIINGAMEVDQEHVGGATTVTSGLYALDMVLVAKTGTMVCAAQQVADAPAGFTNSLKFTVSTAQAALGTGDFVLAQMPVEGYRWSRLGYGTAGAVTTTLCFFTKIHRTGTYSGSLRNAAQNRSYAFSFTQNVADTWELKTVTIPGDTAGTWVGNTNGVGLYLCITMAAGTAMVSTANTWAANNIIGTTGTTNGVAAVTDTFQITGVSLLPGSTPITAATAALLKRTYDQELSLCKRYYQRFPALEFLNAGTVRTSGSAGYFGLLSTVEMRATPTCGFGTGQIIVGDTLTPMTGLTAQIVSGGLNLIPTWTGSIGSIGQSLVLYAGGTGNGITFDARL